MLDAVDGVVDEGPGEGELDTALYKQRQAGEGGGDAGRLKVPAGEGRDEVAYAVGVQRAGEEHAGEALPDGAAEEGLVLVVDLQVWGHRPAQALLGKQRLCVRGRQGLRRGGPPNLEGRREGTLEGGGRRGEEGRGLGGCSEGGRCQLGALLAGDGA